MLLQSKIKEWIIIIKSNYCRPKLYVSDSNHTRKEFSFAINDLYYSTLMQKLKTRMTHNGDFYKVINSCVLACIPQVDAITTSTQALACK